MKRWVWLSVAVAVTMTFAAVAAIAPLGASASPARSAPAVTTPDTTVSWNTGNLCSSLTFTSLGGKVYETCVGAQSDQDLWWNFSNAENYVIQVTEQGSGDCINLNFASFYNTILVTLQGSNYICSGGSSGVNIALNSEGDIFILLQEGSHYTVTTFIYSFTVNYNVILEASYVFDNVYFIGVNHLGEAGQVCPLGITDGLPPYNRIAVRSMIALGSYDNLNTTWVDASGGSVAPYSIAWTPISNGFGVYDYLGYAVTTTVPAGGCSYL